MHALIISAMLTVLLVYVFERHLLPSLGNKYDLMDRLMTYFAFSAAILGVLYSIVQS